MGKHVSVLNIPLHSGSMDSAVNEIIAICETDLKASRPVSATGAHGLITAAKDQGFAAILRGFYLNLPDGMPTVWVGRLKGFSMMQRCYGPDVFAEVMRRTAGTSLRHFLCGGKEGVAEKLKEVCAHTFQNYGCVGTFCPPFRTLSAAEMYDLARTINCSHADIVWIGLSTPKQEIFARELATRVNVHFIITVGAAFDFHIGAVRQAPRFIQRAGMEWLFRLMMEPRRLYKRYMEIVPLFILYNIKELALSCFGRKI